VFYWGEEGGSAGFNVDYQVCKYVDVQIVTTYGIYGTHAGTPKSRTAISPKEHILSNTNFTILENRSI
jgi:hypothetical protein